MAEPVQRTENPLAPPGFKAWIIQPVVSRYTDYIIVAPKDLDKEMDRQIDRFVLGLSPYGHDARRPHKQALCAP